MAKGFLEQSLLHTLSLYFQGVAFTANEDELGSKSYLLCTTYLTPTARQQLVLNAEVVHQQYDLLAAQCSSIAEAKEIEEAADCLLAPFYGRTSGTEPWFNNLIVDRWFDCLCESNPNEKVANIHSRFQEHYVNGLSSNGARQEDRKRLLEANTIFWPICNGFHWYLLTVKKINNKKFSISCKDGLNSHSAHYLDLAQKLLHSLYGVERDDIVICKEDIPMQSNRYDCGPVICRQGQNEITHAKQQSWPDHLHTRLEIANRLIEFFPTPKLFLDGRKVQGKIQRSAPPREAPVIDLENFDLQACYQKKLKV